MAVAHTHPNSNSFSSSDQNYAIARAIDIYVVDPDLNVQKYDHSLQGTTIVGTICPVTLSDGQKEQLRADYQTSWDDHIAAGDANGFDCSSIPWPTE